MTGNACESDGGMSTVLPFPPSERAAIRSSVERGDPLAVFARRDECDHPYWNHSPALSATALVAEPDSPQAVTAHPQTLDTETDGNYPHGVGHAANDGQIARGAQVVSHSMTPLAEFDRDAWLARVQRIDPRERKP